MPVSPPLPAIGPGKTILISGTDAEAIEQVASRLVHGGARLALHLAGAPSPRLEARAVELSDAGCEVMLVKGRLIGRVFACVLRRFQAIDVAIHLMGRLDGAAACEDAPGDDEDERFLKGARDAHAFIRFAGKGVRPAGTILTLRSGVAAASEVARALGEEGSPVAYFTRTAAAELRPRGVSVTAIDLTAEPHGRAQPLDPSPEDVLNLICFLVTEGRWITGVTFRTREEKGGRVVIGPLA